MLLLSVAVILPSCFLTYLTRKLPVSSLLTPKMAPLIRAFEHTPEWTVTYISVQDKQQSGVTPLLTKQYAVNRETFD
jgi:hypothetical protein